MNEQNYNLKESVAELDKLLDLSVEQTDKTACEDLAEKARIIYEQYPKSEDIALRYAMTLTNLSINQTKVDEIVKITQEIKKIYKKFNKPQDIALQYSRALVSLSAEQTKADEIAKIAHEIKEIYKKFNEPQVIALSYAMALANLSAEQTKADEIAETAQEIKEIYKKFNEPQEIALSYAMALVNLSAKQDNVEERLNTVNEVKQIFDSFKHSESIALRYAKTLVNLSAKQDNVEDLLNTVNEVKQIFDSFKHSESIALQYVKVLYNLSNLQNDLNQTNLRVIEILDILKNFSSVEILNILVDMLQNNPDIKLDTDKIPTTSLTKILDKLCLNSNIDTDRDLLIRALNLKLGSDRKLVLNTKYDILNGWIEYYRDDKDDKDKNKLNQLIDIYRIVQEIKFKLGLKEDNNKKLQFGHYTKGSTLQVMLEQEEKKDTKNIFSISGKTRLYNASYMNDPEEGIVIEKVLKSNKEGKIPSYFEDRNILDPSSWFLMSFTSKTDDLTMWSQYGDDAQGVCLVLREDDFSRFTSLNDVPWSKETVFLESENKSEVAISESSSDVKSPSKKLENDNETQLKSEQKDNVSKGNIDYLYRIAYIKNIDSDFELEESELFDDDEINKLDESINHLKQKLYKKLYENDDFYKNAITECIEEIRYLFKSVDYKYENELRILRYANLDPSNDKIKIDKTSGIGKLYVERENPIQIDKVIFGPKFPNPEYVTPLLKLLDKKIKYKKSTIKFR